jgi:hypothetical protein
MIYPRMVNQFLTFLFLFYSAHAMGDLSKAPPIFEFENKQMVFMDISKIHYDLTFDITKREASSHTTITFSTETIGHPLFDLIPVVSRAVIDGTESAIKSISLPGNESKMVAVDSSLPVGEHTLEIWHKWTKGVSFSGPNVSSAFWTSDLSDRGFMEKYLPTNLEFDQFEVKMNVTFVAPGKKQIIYANGDIVEKNPNSFEISFPKHFTSSSVYFHTVPEGKYSELKSEFVSMDGRKVPIVVYGGSFISTKSFMTKAKEVLVELEGDYGVWPHTSVVIYATAGGGGMEYCGATMTSMRALGHELTHSYFARGVMPVRGNSGWIDEAIASWRDKGYETKKILGNISSNLASRSIYRRLTDRGAYTDGRDFMSHLDHLLADDGGLKPFLKIFFANRKFQNVTNQDLIGDLGNHTGQSYKSVFEKYIFKAKEFRGFSKPIENPFHKKWTQAELDQLL